MAEQVSPEALKNGKKERQLPPLHGALLKNEQDVQLFQVPSRRAGSGY